MLRQPFSKQNQILQSRRLFIKAEGHKKASLVHAEGPRSDGGIVCFHQKGEKQ